MKPAVSMGVTVTRPSGIFCSAIPPEISSAALKSPEPRLTPAASPSGKLWIAMAATNSSSLSAWRLWAWISSSQPMSLWIWGTSRSTRLMHPAPAKMPQSVMNSPPFSSRSIAGRMSPRMAAESITPAAKARTMSLNRWEIFLQGIPRMVPSTVAPPTPRAVKHTSVIMYFLSKEEIIIQHMTHLLIGFSERGGG